MRKTRPVIVVSRETGESKKYDSVYAFAKEIGTSIMGVNSALKMGGTVSGWYVYDTPENLRVKIREIEEQIVKLNQLGF